MEKVTKITFEGKHGVLIKKGFRGGIYFSDDEIKSYIKEVFDENITIEASYPESIFSTAGVDTSMGYHDYTVTFWRKAQLSDGRIENNIIRIDRHPDQIVVIGKVDDKKTFKKISNILLAFPEDYDLEYDANTGTLYSTAGQVVLQNVFFDDVQDAVRYQQLQEKEKGIEKLKEEQEAEEIPEVDIGDVLEEEFEEASAPGILEPGELEEEPLETEAPPME